MKYDAADRGVPSDIDLDNYGLVVELITSIKMPSMCNCLDHRTFKPPALCYIHIEAVFIYSRCLTSRQALQLDLKNGMYTLTFLLNILPKNSSEFVGSSWYNKG